MSGVMLRGYAAALALLTSVPAGVRTCHYASWSDEPQPYLCAIQRAASVVTPPCVSGLNIRAGIVTHHFLASALMVRFFATLHARSLPHTVILIGPNHRHQGSANISLSSLPWKTPFGILEVNRSTVQQIEAASTLVEDPEAFAGEHSVGVLIPFVKYYFPHSQVVPILVDVNAREADLKALRVALATLLRNPQNLLLLSMDFSHNSDVATADQRDAAAQQAISALDASQTRGLNVDCRKGLWLLLACLKDLGGVQACIAEHTNSARLTGRLQQPDVTSYFTVYFTRK